MKPEDLQAEGQKKPISDIRSIVKPMLITTAIVAVVVAAVFIVMFARGDEKVPEFLQRWKKIVESGDAQAYEGICSVDFREKFRDLYEETKSLIVDKEIDVSIEDEGMETVRLDDDHYLVKHIPMSLPDAGVQTHQELYLRRSGLVYRRWMIDREGYDFSKAEREELKQIAEDKPQEALERLSKPEQTPRDTEFVIRQTLEVWRTAWENMDLNGYIDCYADYADITRVTIVGGKENQIKLTKSELRDHMARLNKEYGRIRVAIWQPLIIKGNVAVAKADFMQEYTAWKGSDKEPVYHDIGTKELQFVKHDVEWKITNENWRLYKDVPIYPEREL